MHLLILADADKMSTEVVQIHTLPSSVSFSGAIASPVL